MECAPDPVLLDETLNTLSTSMREYLPNEKYVKMQCIIHRHKMLLASSVEQWTLCTHIGDVAEAKLLSNNSWE